MPSLLLALLVHALLLAFLWIGVTWQTTNPVTVEAEVWDMKVESAAAPLQPAPAPEPEPEPEPEPDLAPPPPPPPPAPVIEQAAPTPPDIALAREKQRREELHKKELAEQRAAEKREAELRERERERAEQKKRELAEQKKRDEAERKEKELAEKKLADAKKKEAERLADEKKKKADADAKEKAAKDKAAKDKAAKAEAAALEKFRQDELKRMAGAMGSGGNAVKSTAPKVGNDASYKAAITAAIKSNTAFGGNTSLPGNPAAEFSVEQLPTGEIMSVRLKKSSGVPEFDRAVENGIKKASPLPKRKDGSVERSLDVKFSMKDYD